MGAGGAHCVFFLRSCCLLLSLSAVPLTALCLCVGVCVCVRVCDVARTLMCIRDAWGGCSGPKASCEACMYL